MTSKDPNNHSPQAHVSHSSSSSKGKEPLSNAGPGTRAKTDTATAATTSASTGGFIEAIAASARNAASALDPRQASVITQHHSLNNNTTGGSSSSGFFAGPNSKAGAAASSASRSFQHATTALEKTLEGSSSDAAAFAQPSSSGGFRHPADARSGSGSGTGAMDWDNFLASSDSTVQDDRPYQPPSMSSFNFSALDTPAPAMYQQQPQQHDEQHRQQQAREFDSAFQAHLSQPMNLTPANHAAFLEYLKSTAHPTSQTTPAAAPAPPPHVSSSSVYQQWHTPAHSNVPGMISNDIERQRHMDGSDVLAFLESTSYSDFVDELDSAGGMIEKHQHDRREFVYSEASLGPASPSMSTLFSTLQLIQNLPSERQDIVQYLLSQGTYSDDVWARPFGHDEGSHEAASLAATRAEQDEFLRRQHDKSAQGGEGGGGEGGDATTEEMERVLKQIVDDAKTEVKTGQTDGRAVNRLLMVRSHITMGTKL
ncbi:hypothetical protein BGZ68_010321 [Mortierella alpina]|nr:hypothetical protein BGZ68_010321 [Mortierella alpina]